jgi:flagellar hook-associated protein 1 FlgK
MAGMSSLGIAVSGMSAAQAGLYVIGHNIANSDTAGYVRQQVIQSDFYSNTIGESGTATMQLGLGTDIAAIRQIRDKYLDISYRTEISKTLYYSTKYEVGAEVESIIGELEGEYKFQDVLNDIWSALNELSIDPTGVDTRGNFITTISTFVNKVNNVSDRLFEYQENLNDQVKGSVSDINKIVTRIKELNELIAGAEASGDNANDYRDERNLALDELSGIIDITYKELPNGSVNIQCEGNELLANGFQNHIGLRYTAPNCSFVEPVFTTSKKILPYDPVNKDAQPVFTFTQAIDSVYGNDNGKLKSLIIARGFSQANYTMSPENIDTSTPDGKKTYFSVTNCFIPKVQVEIDTLVHSVVTMINNALSPYDPVTGKQDAANAPYGLDGTQFTEIFVRDNPKYAARFDAAGNIIPENPNEPYSLYTIGNIIVNPDLLNVKNYDQIPLSFSGDVGDQNALTDLLEKWKTGWTDEHGNKFTAVDSDEPLSVDDFYRQVIGNIATEVSEAKEFSEEQIKLATQVDNKRKQISGVSMDEEMKNMLVYQHAYNASSRILNVIDSMIDKLVNGTGRVGL